MLARWVADEFYKKGLSNRPYTKELALAGRTKDPFGADSGAQVNRQLGSWTECAWNSSNSGVQFIQDFEIVALEVRELPH